MEPRMTSAPIRLLLIHIVYYKTLPEQTPNAHTHARKHAEIFRLPVARMWPIFGRLLSIVRYPLEK